MNGKTKGDISEAAILTGLLKHGAAVSIPFGDNHRYDLIVDSGGRLWKVQCKTGRLINGSVEFPTASSSNGDRRGYTGEVDCFGVYSRETGSVYIVPLKVATQASKMRLRVDAPRKYGNQKHIHWAKDYELGPDSFNAKELEA